MTANEIKAVREYMLFAVDELNEITKLQAEVINDLFGLLSQHLTAEEMDGLPVKEKIDQVARIRAEINLH